MYYSSLRVASTTKDKLEALKEHKRESFDDVLNRLVEYAPQVKDELISDLVKDAEEFEKHPHKRYTSIQELRKEIEGK
ncbi:MAG TPA: hypothetical protein PKK60_00060 [archaeon]|nr:hypothetical protein [archaeon]